MGLSRVRIIDRSLIATYRIVTRRVDRIELAAATGMHNAPAK